MKMLGIIPKSIWEPACGNNAMLDVLRLEFPKAKLLGTDIRGTPSVDFILDTSHDWPCHAVITNPPYRKDLIAGFIARALAVTQAQNGMVAMLLRVDFDSAKTRACIFGEHPAWFGKIVMNKRVMWFDPPPGEKKKGPSENHAWYIWDWSKVPSKPPIILYGPH
jgi:hypothetical protein